LVSSFVVFLVESEKKEGAGLISHPGTGYTQKREYSK
jgi:hypothetical protein